MKSWILSLSVFLFLPVAWGQAPGAQDSVTRFTLRADRSYSFLLQSHGLLQDVMGNFALVNFERLTNSQFDVSVRLYDRHVMVSVIRTGQRMGQLFILEAVNGQFLQMNARPMTGLAQNIAVDATDLINAAIRLSNGDEAKGFRRLTDSFGQNSSLTIQDQLLALNGAPTAVLAAVPAVEATPSDRVRPPVAGKARGDKLTGSVAGRGAPIPVGQRKQLQFTRSFEDFENGVANPTAPKPVKRRKRKPRPSQAHGDMTPSYRTTVTPSAAPMNLSGFRN